MTQAEINPTPSRREQKKQQNRAIIIAAAKRVFLISGYEATSIRDIVRETPLATGTFYNYFPDKESLFRTIVTENILALTHDLHAARTTTKSLEIFVSSSYGAYFKHIANDPITYEIIRQNSNIVNQIYSSNEMKAARKSLYSDVRNAIDNGTLPSVDADYLAAAFLGIGYEMGRRLITKDDSDHEQAAQFATALFVGGIPEIARTN